MNRIFNILIPRQQAFGLMLLLLLIAGGLKGQPSVTIGNHLSCEESSTLIPVYAAGFQDIGTFTFFITIDTLQLRFISVENPNSQMAGNGIITNFIPSTSSIGLTWFSMTGINILNDKLFDLKMTYYSGEAAMSFTDNCEMSLSDGTILENVVYTDGLVLPAIEIGQQPQSITVTEGEQAQFTLEMSHTGNQLFRWQTFTNDVWVDLEETALYSGVQSNQLTITSVPLTLNNTAYRCVATYEDCSAISDQVTLTVSPLSVLDDRQAAKSLLTIYPNPFTDNVFFDVNAPVPDFHFQVVNMMGDVVFNDYPLHRSGRLELEHLAPGIYFLQIESGNRTLQTVKLLKR